MKLLLYKMCGTTRIGALAGERVVDLQRAYAAFLSRTGETPSQAGGLAAVRIPTDMLSFLRTGRHSLDAAQQGLEYFLENGVGDTCPAGMPLAFLADDVKVERPFSPKSIICPGPTPSADDGMLQHGEFYIKSAHTALGPGDPFPYQPRVSEHFFHQVEVGVVVGKGGRNISRRDVWDHILGLTVFVSIMAPEQFQPAWEGTMWHIRYSEGASFDGAAIIGPCITTIDEIRDVSQLRLQSWVNDVACEDHLLQGLYRDIPTFVSHVSGFITLEPGILISSGSPNGPVLYRGIDQNPHVRFPVRPVGGLMPGDLLRTAVSQIGEMDNPVVPEHEASLAGRWH